MSRLVRTVLERKNTTFILIKRYAGSRHSCEENILRIEELMKQRAVPFQKTILNDTPPGYVFRKYSG